MINQAPTGTVSIPTKVVSAPNNPPRSAQMIQPPICLRCKRRSTRPGTPATTVNTIPVSSLLLPTISYHHIPAPVLQPAPYPTFLAESTILLSKHLHPALQSFQ
ncbi:hypothetical protein K469DRAFT_702813 [Zopfia rhizophila CBS 207.26]|uniref:Uncharacterized protein n=1 Tax=Zopfia rhizophila CBS 207.26 TaxID=1314779 RepID=A0A6A6EDF0_9PEZI|nr:hypothetical protein K469DRAFT_702813 [Zopfia rhizophila CBS 207.26]